MRNSIFHLFLFLTFLSTTAVASDITQESNRKLSETLACYTKLEIVNITDFTDILYDLYYLNVFSYYKLKGSDILGGMTPLEKQEYKKTQAYQGYLSDLKELKTKMKDTYYYFELPFDINSYDIEKRGFSLNLKTNSDEMNCPFELRHIVGILSKSYLYSCLFHLHERPAKSIFDILFLSLPSEIVNYKDGIFREHLLIQINEDIALPIEKNRGDAKVYLIFRITGEKKVKHRYSCTGRVCITKGWSEIEKTLLVADSVRIVIGNEKEDVCYFDKEYKVDDTISKKKTTIK